MRGSCSSVRAMDSRCRSPMERPNPRSPHQGGVPGGQLHDAVVDVCRLGGGHYLLVGGVWLPVAQVVLDGGLEQVGLLGHEPHGGRQVGEPDLPHVGAVDGHRSLGYVVETAGTSAAMLVFPAPLGPTKAAI